jgi:hypothetical protein
MVETVIRLLIGLCLLVLCVVLVIWVLGELGIVLPAIVMKIGWVILVLIVILIIYRTLKPVAGGWLP